MPKAPKRFTTSFPKVCFALRVSLVLCKRPSVSDVTFGLFVVHSLSAPSHSSQSVKKSNQNSKLENFETSKMSRLQDVKNPRYQYSDGCQAKTVKPVKCQGVECLLFTCQGFKIFQF